MRDSHVLVVDAEAAAEYQCAEGLAARELVNQKIGFDNSSLYFLPRQVAEVTPCYRQIIPYVVIRRGSSVLAYRRSASGSETRLSGLWSIGWGGHVELCDVALLDGSLDLLGTLRACATREVWEELRLHEPASLRFAGLIADDSTDVGRVHLGWVEEWMYTDNVMVKPDESATEVQWVDVARAAALTPIETWSARALTMLRP